MSSDKPWIHIDRLHRRLGHRVIVLDSCGSTNTIAIELARSGATDGTLVMARQQTEGKGRLGRRWESWPGNLAMSLVVRPNLPIDCAYRLVFASACAVVEALAEFKIEASIKWPNDILIKAFHETPIEKLGPWRKIGGILLEVSSTNNKLDAAIIGIGLNISRPPPDKMHSLIPQMGFVEDITRDIPLTALVEKILNALETHLAHSENIANFHELMSATRNKAAFLGERIRVDMGSNFIKGIAEDFSSDGGLVIRDDFGRLETIFFGDVHLDQSFTDA